MSGNPGSGTPAEVPVRQRFGIGWSEQAVRLLFLVLAVTFLIWLARGIIGPFVVAGVLAYAFSPVVTGVQSRTRLPRAAVIGMGYVLLVAIVAGVSFLLAQKAGSELSDLSSGGHDVVSSALHKLFGDTLVVAGNTLSVEDVARQVRQSFLGLLSSPTDAVHMAERAVDIALQVILCLIITFYFLLDGSRFGRFAPVPGPGTARGRASAGSPNPRSAGALAAWSAASDRACGDGHLHRSGSAAARSVRASAWHSEWVPGDHSARRTDDRRRSGRDRGFLGARDRHDAYGPRCVLHRQAG